MSFRVSAAVAAVVVLELAAFSPVAAQPQVPVRPRYSQFNDIFRPGAQPIVPGQFGGVQPGFGQNVPMAPGFIQPGFIQPGAAFPGGVYPQGLVYGIDPRLAPTGVAATFNNLGHWYGGNLGHWYPNGIANGRGILGYAAGNGVYGGGGFGGGLYGGSVGFGATGPGMGRSGAPLLGATMTGAAAVGAIRR